MANTTRLNGGIQKRLLMWYFSVAFLFRPSSGLLVQAGAANFLSTVDPGEIVDLLFDLTLDLDTAVDSQVWYGPGIIASSRYDLSNGYTIISQLTYWNVDTCNLGKGGEQQHPIITIQGVLVRAYMFDILLPAIRNLINGHFGYGLAIHENLSLHYFPAYTSLVSTPPDNDPASHEHLELLEKEPLQNFRNKNVKPDLIRDDSGFLSSFNSTGGVARAKTVSPAATHRFDARIVIQSHSNFTNKTTVAHPSRKFPVDPNGDCDLLGTGLMWGFAPSYDDSSRHGIQVLNPTDQIWSPNTRFLLVMQTDCNLVLYDNRENKPLWASGTQYKGRVCYATLTTAGELIVYDTTIDHVLFQTNTWCTGNGGNCWTNTVLEVQDDGNLVLYIFDTEYAIWSSKPSSARVVARDRKVMELSVLCLSFEFLSFQVELFRAEEERTEAPFGNSH